MAHVNDFEKMIIQIRYLSDQILFLDFQRRTTKAIY